VSNTDGVDKTEKFANESHWNLVSSWHSIWHSAGGNLPHLLHTLIMRDTLATGGWSQPSWHLGAL